MRLRSILVTGCIAVTWILGGCEVDVAAPDGLDGPYSLYGILNPDLDTQTVSVSPIEPLLYNYPESIDASVTSMDVETGETQSWNDSVTIGERGQRDHVFYAAFRPHYGSTYHVTAERSDGAVATAVARVPEKVAVATADSGSYVIHVNVLGRDFAINGIELLYSVRRFTKEAGRVVGEARVLCDSDFWHPLETYSVSYTGKETAVGGGYQVDVNLALDHEKVLAEYQFAHPFEFIPRISGIALMNLQVRLIVGEEAWDPPGGSFDANALAEAGTMSNVDNGFGFVGGGYNHQTRIFPSEEAVDTSLFFDSVQRPPSTCADFCQCGQG